MTHQVASLRAPEGDFRLICDRRPASLTFNPDLRTCILLVDLQRGPSAGKYIIWSLHSTIFVYKSSLEDDRVCSLVRNDSYLSIQHHWINCLVHLKPNRSLSLHHTQDPYRRIDLRQSTTTNQPPPAPSITCMAFCTESSDEYDLLVGMSTGEGRLFLANNINCFSLLNPCQHHATYQGQHKHQSSYSAVKVLSLSAQLSSNPTNMKPSVSLAFNSDANLDASKCISVFWLLSSKGNVFTSVHSDGCVLMHQKLIGSSSDTELLARSSSSPGIRPPVRRLRNASKEYALNMTSACISPISKQMAVTLRDGTLRILDVDSGMSLGGFRSYYGNFLCCAYSPDGRYIAAGGEDDLVAVYGVRERQVLMHCEGHSSWISSVAFDPVELPELASPGEVQYRIVSVGQDCQIAFWDLSIASSTFSMRSHAEGDVVSPPASAPSLSMRRLQANPMMLTEDSGAFYSAGSSPRTPKVARATPRSEMTCIAPSVLVKCHFEPLCCVVCSDDAVIVSGHDGCVKKWRRPPSMASS